MEYTNNSTHLFTDLDTAESHQCYFYDAILNPVNEISLIHHTKVMDKWLREWAFVKFVGDNVDKQCNVRDIRSDHHGELRHMFSLLAIKARISPPAPLPQFSPPRQYH